MDLSFSRRRFLAISSTGLATITAGCSYPTSGIQDEDTDPDDVTDQRPTDAAIQFNSPNGKRFSLTDLPIYKRWYHPILGGSPYGTHPDSRVSTAIIDDRTITITIDNALINRDLTLTIRTQTDIETEDLVTTTISPESDDYQTYERTYTIDEAFPPNKPAHIKILLSDSHKSSTTQYILKDHQAIGIPYKNADTNNGIRWVNDEALNYVSTEDNGGIDISENLYTEIIETNNDRTRFFVLNYPSYSEPLYGAYSTISKSRYNDYLEIHNRGDYIPERHHPLLYIYHAEDYEMFTSLANSFASTLDANGITDQWNRLQMLAYLVGCITYNFDEYNDAQIYSLWNFEADCSEASIIYSALLNTSSFNYTRTAIIDCVLGDVNHAVVGIDERDLNPPNPETIYWLDNHGFNNPFPETRYAITEMTTPRDIGYWDTEHGTIYGIVDTSEIHQNTYLK